MDNYGTLYLTTTEYTFFKYNRTQTKIGPLPPPMPLHARGNSRSPSCILQPDLYFSPLARLKAPSREKLYELCNFSDCTIKLN